MELHYRIATPSAQIVFDSTYVYFKLQGLVFYIFGVDLRIFVKGQYFFTLYSAY